MSESMADVLASLEDLYAKVKALCNAGQSQFSELFSLRFDTDRLRFSQEGAEGLFVATVEYAAMADRASIIAAEAQGSKGAAAAAVRALEQRYQQWYDAYVVRQVNLLEGKSWSERESFYRIKVLDLAILRRKVLAEADIINATVDAIVARNRDIQTLRFTLSAATEALKFAHTLGQLPVESVAEAPVTSYTQTSGTKL